MMLRNYSVYEGSKDPAKGGMLLVKAPLTKREANRLAEQIRKQEKRAAVYRGNEPRSFF